MKENDGIFMRIGKYKFFIVCHYSDCFIPKDDVNNNYSMIDSKISGRFDKLSGLYAFVNDNGEIIYIGESHDRPLSCRIKQHFRSKDTGGLRYRLSHEGIMELERSTLYVCPLKLGKNEIQTIERELITTYAPKFNLT